jgi:hypothetical protein
MQQPIQTTPAWMSAVPMRLAALSIRSVVRKKTGRVYIYWYVRLDSALFPEARNAKRLRLVVVPPDFTAPPVIVTARLFQRGQRVYGFVVDSIYQRVVVNYARNNHIGVLATEVIESEKQTEAPRS